MFKQSIVVDDKSTEITKAIIDVNCDVQRVFSVIQNPEHFRHLTDLYLDSVYLQQFGIFSQK